MVVEAGLAARDRDRPHAEPVRARRLVVVADAERRLLADLGALNAEGARPRDPVVAPVDLHLPDHAVGVAGLDGEDPLALALGAGRSGLVEVEDGELRL